MIIYLPIAIAIESKPIVSVALKEIGQVINYTATNLYDAVFIRIESTVWSENNELQMLENVAELHGIGIIAGGETYAPITNKDKIIQPAFLSLKGDPAKLYQKGCGMTLISQLADDFSLQITDLMHFRRIFYTDKIKG